MWQVNRSAVDRSFFFSPSFGSELLTQTFPALSMTHADDAKTARNKTRNQFVNYDRFIHYNQRDTQVRFLSMLNLAVCESPVFLRPLAIRDHRKMMKRLMSVEITARARM